MLAITWTAFYTKGYRDGLNGREFDPGEDDFGDDGDEEEMEEDDDE